MINVQCSPSTITLCLRYPFRDNGRKAHSSPHLRACPHLTPATVLHHKGITSRNVQCSLFTEIMPLYEYRCNPCGEFEAWRSMSEYNAPTNCPDCNQVATKIFSALNINLNSGSLSAIAKNSEPRLVKQEPREPAKPRYHSSGDRPWMISHTPERL